MKPLVALLIWERLGFTIQSLESIFSLNSDFDLILLNNGSSDKSREYLSSVTDPRIKEVKHFKQNNGFAYAFNYALSNRLPGQAALFVGNDMQIASPNHLLYCQKISEAHPEIGMIGLHDPATKYESFLSLGLLVEYGISNVFTKYPLVNGGCEYFPSDTLDQLGYLSEDWHLGDVELCRRVAAINKKVACLPHMKATHLDDKKKVNCPSCKASHLCNNLSCFDNYKTGKHQSYFKNQYKEFLAMKEFAVFQGSLHDPSSLIGYNLSKALENFRFFRGY